MSIIKCTWIKLINQWGQQGFQYIKKIDQIFLQRKIYQWLCVVLFVATLLPLMTSYNINVKQSNYTKQSINSIRLDFGIPVSFSFDATNRNLESFNLYKSMSESVLTTSDKANVRIDAADGSTVLSTEIYLYSPNRNYIAVNCGNISLEKGSRYTVIIQATSLAPESVCYLKSHELNTFSTMTSDISDVDAPLGITLLPNVTFSYSILSVYHMLPHQILVVLLFAGLFFSRLINRRWVREVYRGFFACFLIYLIQEILNIAKSDPMQMLFPFTLQHYFVVGAGLALIILVYLLLYAILGRGTWAILITGFLGILLGYVNHFKILYRGDPALPWDLFSAGMAAKISTKYQFHITERFVASILMVLIFLIVVRLTVTPAHQNIRKRILPIIGASLLLGGFLFGVILNQTLLKKADVSYALFPPLQSYNENGVLLAVALHLNDFSIKGGENNSLKATTDYIAQYVEEAKAAGLDKANSQANAIKPNVICIMSESFSDLNEIRQIETTEPALPFYSSLKEDSLYGDLAVSIFGGGTCNTEFEFLTGYSVRNLLAGSPVYSLYVQKPLDALPQIFKDQGYETIAIHPFDPLWWGRIDAYPLLGFDKFISQDDFYEPKMVREYISDQSAFERIIKEYENKDPAKPLFTFMVTMQNHADYTQYYNNQKYDLKITNFPGQDFVQTEHYMSLLKESDDALKYLVNYFAKVKEPTIIVIFGDHKPFLDLDLYSTLLGEDISKISSKDSLPLYTTPYLIWANYNIEKGKTSITSPNFLGQTVLDLATIPSPDERSCLRVLQTKINAVSAVAVFDKDGSVYTSEDSLPADVSKLLNDYRFIQYGQLFLTKDSQ